MFQHEAKYQLALFIGPAIFAVWAGLFLPHFGAYGILAVSVAAIGFLMIAAYFVLSIFLSIYPIIDEAGNL